MRLEDTWQIVSLQIATVLRQVVPTWQPLFPTGAQERQIEGLHASSVLAGRHWVTGMWTGTRMSLFDADGLFTPDWEEVATRPPLRAAVGILAQEPFRADPVSAECPRPYCSTTLAIRSSPPQNGAL